MRIDRSTWRKAVRWALAGWLLLTAAGATGATNILNQEGADERRRRMLEQVREQVEAQQAAAASALADTEAAHNRRNRYPELNELSRHVTALALLLTGLLLLANPVAERIPALDPVADRMLPAAPFVGLAAILVGGLDLVLDLVSLRWVGDTLPVILLLVSGIAALRLVRTMPSKAEPNLDHDEEPRSKLHQFAGDTVQSVQRALQGKRDRTLLERLALPIGIICILAAVAHWMAGDLTVL